MKNKQIDHISNVMSKRHVPEFELEKIKKTSFWRCYKSRCCISLIDVAQNLILITSNYIYFKLLMILFSI